MKTPFPIHSMTGFARASTTIDGALITLEARSVNHRFLEVAIKAPRSYSAFERELKAALQHVLRRGRVDIFISRESVSAGEAAQDGNPAIKVPPFVDDAVRVYLATCHRFGASAASSGEGLATFIGQLLLRQLGSHEEVTEISEREQRGVVELVRGAADKLVEMRRLEGRALADDILLRLATLARYREAVVTKGAHAPSRLRERLSERLAALAPDMSVSPDRVAQEVALLAERVDTSEELSRLEIHLKQFTTLINEGHQDGVGRKLDFMTQEIGRELNTIASKAQDASVQQIVVDAKAEAERIREQVQNIE